MLAIPIVPVPSQVLRVTLAGQDCTIALYARSTGLFLNLAVSDVPVVSGVVCQHRNRIVRSAYLGFAGDLAIYDTTGTDDPLYTGLGTRWVLVYVEAADLIAAGLAG
jgi:hypothetical protein